MSNNQKSGYAIRADLLGMAIGILESRNSQLRDKEFMLKKNDDSYQMAEIPPFSTAEVLKTAEELYKFVQNKG